MFPTRMLPLRSRITPRGASTRTVRSRLFCAARRYCSPESTCSAQRRRKRMAKMPSATAPRIARRSASFGVRRYGSTTRGSGGRNAGEPLPRLAKEPHLLRGPLGAAEHAPHERVDREREDQVQQHAGDERADEDRRPRRPGRRARRAARARRRSRGPSRPRPRAAARACGRVPSSRRSGRSSSRRR